MAHIIATTILLCVLFIWVIVYNAYFWKNKVLPESISATSYLLINNQRNEKWFSLFCISIGFTLFVPWLTISQDMWRFLVFLCCSGIVFAGTTPFYRESYQKYIHYISGMIALIAYITWMMVSGYYVWLLTEFVLWCITLIFAKEKYVYFGEIICLIGLIALLIYDYYQL